MPNIAITVQGVDDEKIYLMKTHGILTLHLLCGITYFYFYKEFTSEKRLSNITFLYSCHGVKNK
jgi:hypothetical protein